MVGVDYIRKDWWKTKFIPARLFEAICDAKTFGYTIPHRRNECYKGIFDE
jgi:hypothetical protein